MLKHRSVPAKEKMAVHANAKCRTHTAFKKRLHWREWIQELDLSEPFLFQ